MLFQLAEHFNGFPLTVVFDSWFGNNGLFKPVRKHLGGLFHLLSRLRSNTILYSMAPKRTTGKQWLGDPLSLIAQPGSVEGQNQQGWGYLVRWAASRTRRKKSK
ncbi:MAG: hypothetical protein JRD05_10430 [Deltaproteobacteria bacterium]|nr:hypothetical protein [Deltaproteobacteria bacterium]